MTTFEILMKLHRPAEDWFGDWKTVTFWEHPPRRDPEEGLTAYRARVGRGIRALAVSKIADKLDSL